GSSRTVDLTDPHPERQRRHHLIGDTDDQPHPVIQDEPDLAAQDEHDLVAQDEHDLTAEEAWAAHYLSDEWLQHAIAADPETTESAA
ncbi:MAG: hypothetical protein ACRCZP_08820, partial [Phycicoccus sp.]